MTDKTIKTGSCLCGAVKYETTGKLRPVMACHCHQCRKLTGHHMAATASLLKNFSLVEDRGLSWYRSSDYAKRGFCKECGATLFWQMDGARQISITAGSLDDDSGIGFWGHSYCTEKGSYYKIPDDELRTAGRPKDYPILEE